VIVWILGRIGKIAVIARKLASTQRILCASPAYLTRQGTPKKREDLAKHNCLRIERRHITSGCERVLPR
jgi:DNA-binding transcriptional LysR family regulator